MARPVHASSAAGRRLSDIKSVMDRMGHAQMTTTQKYIHTLRDADADDLTTSDRIAAPARIATRAARLS